MNNNDFGPEIKIRMESNIDPNDFPYLTEKAKVFINEEKEEQQSLSYADVIQDTTSNIEPEAFIGEYPFETIMEAIKFQFNNYIGAEDRTNYVEIFYNQMKASMNVANDDEEEFPQEKIDVLNKLKSEFISEVSDLFKKRLSITFMDLESEEWDENDIEYQFSLLYEYFIIDARKTLKKFIVTDILHKLPHITDDRLYYKEINRMLESYSPLIVAAGPMEFLRVTGAEDIFNLYDEGRIVGNFLRRFSPRLFQYDDFKVEIITEITMRDEVKTEMTQELRQNSV